MSLYTKFLKLIKPEGNEYYNIEHFNHNSELIDKKIEEHSTALTTIQQGATNEQKGIVQFGIEEGKALEGNMLARLAGAYGFGGDIQTSGVKNQNYIYYDNNTRKMYKCLNQNSDTSANVQNYIPMDNFSILDRLENLIKSELLFDGRAIDTGTILIQDLPDWVKTLKIQGSNDNIYFFDDLFISLNSFENDRKTTIINMGNIGDTRVYSLSLINGVLKIKEAQSINNTSGNNFIRKIYGLSY